MKGTLRDKSLKPLYLIFFFFFLCNGVWFDGLLK